MPMDGTQFVVSMLGGGLAGGCVNTIFNRIFYWRSLRIRFYPQLSHMFSTYRIRIESSEGRYLISTPGQLPLPNDANFVRHRGAFLSGLIDFTELKETRVLRKTLLANEMTNASATNGTVQTDLMPEYDALLECVRKVQEKLRLS